MFLYSFTKLYCLLYLHICLSFSLDIPLYLRFCLSALLILFLSFARSSFFFYFCLFVSPPFSRLFIFLSCTLFPLSVSLCVSISVCLNVSSLLSSPVLPFLFLSISYFLPLFSVSLSISLPSSLPPSLMCENDYGCQAVVVSSVPEFRVFASIFQKWVVSDFLFLSPFHRILLSLLIILIRFLSLFFIFPLHGISPFCIILRNLLSVPGLGFIVSIPLYIHFCPFLHTCTHTSMHIYIRTYAHIKTLIHTHVHFSFLVFFMLFHILYHMLSLFFFIIYFILSILHHFCKLLMILALLSVYFCLAIILLFLSLS